MTDTANVPREPTRKMVMSGAAACDYEIGPAKIKATYRAMLAAAPKAEPDWNYAGAMADLESAITVLIRRINGEADLASAAEWVRLNYPSRASEIVAQPEAPKVEQEPCKGCGNTKPVGPEYISCCPDGPRHKPASASDELPSISLDGPHKPNEHRVWLARQLLDSNLTDAEAYGIVAYHPAILGLAKHKGPQS